MADQTDLWLGVGLGLGSLLVLILIGYFVVHILHPEPSALTEPPPPSHPFFQRAYPSLSAHHDLSLPRLAPSPGESSRRVRAPGGSPLHTSHWEDMHAPGAPVSLRRDLPSALPTYRTNPASVSPRALRAHLQRVSWH